MKLVNKNIFDSILDILQDISTELDEINEMLTYYYTCKVSLTYTFKTKKYYYMYYITVEIQIV